MEISFYQTLDDQLLSSVVRLLEKIYISNMRCVFYSPVVERVQIVDKTLWTFSTNAFIPHGDRTLGFSDVQPIYFTDKIENPNDAKALLMMDSFDYEIFNFDFRKIVIVFGSSAVSYAETKFNDLKKRLENVNYWRQSTNGWGKL